jgi:hypothetical protein
MGVTATIVISLLDECVERTDLLPFFVAEFLTE